MARLTGTYWDRVKNRLPGVSIASRLWRDKSARAGMSSYARRRCGVPDLLFVILTVAVFLVLALVVRGAERL